MSLEKRAWIPLGLLLLVGSAGAGDGLAVPDVNTLWSPWQARLSVTLERPLGLVGSAPSAGIQRAELFGDYYPQRFALAPSSSWRGGLRATGGLIVGQPGLSAGLGMASASGLQTTVDETHFGTDAGAGNVWPYIGIGYSGLSRRSGWGFTADVGLVVQSPGAGLTLGRAPSAAAGLDDTLREIRLSPMVQMGVRYAF